MLKNYLLVALRSLRRNKTYAAINIVGLTLGITACLLIGLYIWQETHYDKFHQNAERIVRVTMEYGEGSEKQEAAVTGTKVGPEFARKFPAVEAFTRTIIGTRVVANGEKKFTEDNVLFADSAFFRIFSFPLLEGDAFLHPRRCQTRRAVVYSQLCYLPAPVKCGADQAAAITGHRIPERSVENSLL